MKSKKNLTRFTGVLCLTFVCFTLSTWLLFIPNSFAVLPRLGVVEISQSDVPFVITKPGSYRLISNLRVTSQTGSAIGIYADNVTIDLNGFTIKGPGWTAGEESFGIRDHLGRSMENVVVRNGKVIDFGNVGVHLPGTNNRVENVQVLRTGHDGIFVGKASVVSQCQVAFCDTAGINTDDGSMVLNNTVYDINGSGIGTSGGAEPIGGVTVIGNNIRLCSFGVIPIGNSNRIEGNTITQCTIGIDLEFASNTYFAKNLLQGNGSAIEYGFNYNIDGGIIDPALSNIEITLP